MNLDKENFVRVRAKGVSLVSYMFYLTYGKRALVANGSQNDLFLGSNITAFCSDYFKLKKKDQGESKLYYDYTEVVFSQSRDFNQFVLDYLREGSDPI